MKLVDGQVAVVTGAASGIGRSLATQLSSRGLAVVLADLPGDRLEEATALASEAGGEALAVACDVRHRPDVEALAARVLERCGRVDLVCLNAGVLHDAAPLWALDPAVVDQVLAVNLYGVLHGVGALVPLLVAQGSGHVLLTASMSGVARTRYVGAYATSKFAVVGLAESLAGELGEQAPGVGVTVVCPGMVRTPLTAPMLGPLAGGLIVDYLHWRFVFFLNLPIGLAGLVLVYTHLPDYREPSVKPLDIVGLILFGSGVALLSYVLEIFGDHTLGTGEILGLLGISLALIAGYALHARHTQYPLLQMSLFRIRTFAASVSGSFITRLGIGGVPFLLPLLYQVGLGYTPVQSGLLIMPQAAAAMCSKIFITQILRRVGYRGVLVSNTILLGVLLMVFATIGRETPVWLILLQAFFYGALTSLQYTSMNTLVYADIKPSQTSNASSIASTAQQMAISFGVAAAGLTTAFFVPASVHANPDEMIRGLHEAFLVLGIFTILSTVVFYRLKSGDGRDVSQQKDVHLG